MRMLLLLALLLGGAPGCGSRGTGEGGHDDHAGETAGGHEDHDDHAGETAGEHDDHDGHDDGESADARARDDAGEDVLLTPEQRAAAGIALETAGPGSIALRRSLPGEVVVNADALAHIVPRFPGVAREVRKKLGDRVRAGEVLAVINSNESLSSYEVTSLIDGIVIEKHITLGEFVQDDQDIYVVADLSTVWVHLTLYPGDLDEVAPGLDVVVRASGTSATATGRIAYVGPIVGEATRTALARIVLANLRGEWRPGLFVTGDVTFETRQAPVVVRDAALQTLEGATVVFVEESPGRFAARTVEVGATDGEWTILVAGLAPGESYVAAGAFILKSEKLKSEAGHDH
jgi:cobalt-zinc-cadmium efflux system membrane fusion protein